MSTALLPAIVFLSAASCLAVELAIVRLAAPHVGQSLLPWTAAITTVLLGLTLGHVLGGRAGGREARPERLRQVLAMACLWAGGSTMAMPALVSPIARALAAEDGAGYAVGLIALCLPPSLAAGFVTPLALRLQLAQGLPDIGRPVAAVYAASAAGSVAGTAAAGFWLLEPIGAAGLAATAAVAWTAIGLAFMPWRRSRHSALLHAVLPLFVGLAIALAGEGSPCTVESRYTCIRYLDTPSPQGTRLRFMILDEGVHSASDLDAPRALHLGYAALSDRLAAAAFSGAAEPSALVIGGGGATLPRAWANGSRPVSVVVAELDPVVAAEAATRMAAAGPRLRTVIGDGRNVLRSQAPVPTHDVVLMDAYRTRTVPPHLVTQEFGALVHARLNETGVFLSNVIDRGDTLLLARSLARTLSRDYAAVDIWLAEGAAAERTTNAVVAAWKKADSALRPDRITVPVSIMAAGEAPSPAHVTWRRLAAGPVSAARWGRCATILTDDHAPVDRLLDGRAFCNPE
ncbi:fused MFS/spermidine synthase [Bosea sp. ANAM02]|uniref:fused MFS/spermidine synthase n=1 Tax=Bosea sp. ANAM02 TaxID=2020412 RepID=UPI00140E96BF|nr:fused MFS/spermidine synthase [Bosea sp. ANAM02]BCB21210.1 hypothetical protein OCUBac02_41040 [Bosea sp. ANAM02]